MHDTIGGTGTPCDCEDRSWLDVETDDKDFVGLQRMAVDPRYDPDGPNDVAENVEHPEG